MFFTERPTVLLTGASGFIGRALARALACAEFKLVACSRRSENGVEPRLVIAPELDDRANWMPLLQGVDVVIHAAGKAHDRRPGAEQESDLRRINVDGTLTLAKQALASGVERFIFLSSIGVNGQVTAGGMPFSEASLPSPTAAYAFSKLQAEVELLSLLNGTSMRLTVIRPPLVYAADAPGNFQRLLRLVALGVPLPFGAVANKRSMVALENMVDFVLTCVANPMAAGEIFLVSDGMDLSIGQIIEEISVGMGMEKRKAIFKFPASVLSVFAKSIGRSDLYAQICESLVIDSQKARRQLNWTPPVSATTALRNAGSAYIAGRGR